MRDTLKKIFLVDMMYGFIAAALALMVPLYLLDSGLDIASIGLIISIVPLAFMLMRIIFASIADQVGTKTIEVLESLATIVAISIYAFTRSARMFAVAQFSEGIRDAGFWATARTDVMKVSSKKDVTTACAYMVGLRQFADALGRISVGLLIIYFSFTVSFYFLLALSFVMLVLILTINKNPFKNFIVSDLIVRKIMHRRSKTFWQHSFLLAIQHTVPGVLMVFLLPVYLYSELGLDYYGTASMLAIFSLVIAASNLTAAKLRLKTATLLFFVFLMVPALILFTHSGKLAFIPIIVLAIGTGCGNILAERLVSHDVSKHKDISTEVGVIYFPLMFLQFLFISLGGVAVEAWGYLPIFYLLGFMILFNLIHAREVFSRFKNE